MQVFFRSLFKSYENLPLAGKLLLFCIAILAVIAFFKSGQRENFTDNDKEFEHKEGAEIYDTFYADIYDQLVFSHMKNEYEIGQITNKTHLTERSVVLDIGSGTGHHVALLTKDGAKAIGLDNSGAMIKQAKKEYPEGEFVLGDAMNSNVFPSGSFTHILSLYFTIYYMKNKELFFANCMNWLMPGGYLVIHLVDREMFDPILPPANPLMFLTPQRYSENRITKSMVTFNGFKYDSNFELNPKDHTAMFVERFRNRDSGKVFRKQEHKMYMETDSRILQMAKDAGFILQEEIDLIHSGYEYHKLYVLLKPN